MSQGGRPSGGRQRDLRDEAAATGGVKASDGTEYYMTPTGQMRLVKPKMRGKALRRKEKRERVARRKR